MGSFSDEALFPRRSHSIFILLYNQRIPQWASSEGGIKRNGKRRFQRSCEVLVGGRFSLALLMQLQRLRCISVLCSYPGDSDRSEFVMGRGVWARTGQDKT